MVWNMIQGCCHKILPIVDYHTVGFSFLNVEPGGPAKSRLRYFGID